MSCLNITNGRNAESFPEARTQVEAEEQDANIARAVSMGRRDM